MKSKVQKLAEIGREMARKKHGLVSGIKKPGDGSDEGGEQRELQPGQSKKTKKHDDQR